LAKTCKSGLHSPVALGSRIQGVTPITAELWDGPASKAVAAFEFAKARPTGAKPNLGQSTVMPGCIKPQSCRGAANGKWRVPPGGGMSGAAAGAFWRGSKGLS
jgi:hypothetical protein